MKLKRKSVGCQENDFVFGYAADGGKRNKYTESM